MLWMYCIVKTNYRSESLTSSRARRDAIAICINCLAVWGSGKRRHIADQPPLMVCVRVVKFETTLGRLSSSSMHAFGRTYTPVM